MELAVSEITTYQLAWCGSLVVAFFIMHSRHWGMHFELRGEIFCVPICFYLRIPKPCLSVRPYPEKRYHPSFVNMSPTLVIDTSMERSSRVLVTVLQHENPNIWISFQKKVEIEFWLVFWLVLKNWNLLSFVNISLTLVNDTRMERCWLTSFLLRGDKNLSYKKTCLSECFCCHVL